MTRSDLKAIGDNLVIELEEEEDKTRGGIYLPESVDSQNKVGKVLSVGPKVEGINEGDMVMLAKHSFVSRTIDLDHRILIVPNEDVLAIIYR